MHMFHFGASERKLLGSYLPPFGPARPSEVVVIANPWGWEALRAHRTTRMLATILQREGFGVFRFDYYGTGDSFGRDEDTSLEGWTEDLEWAVEEAQAMAGKRRVILIGLRLGAFLAAKVAARSPNQVSKIVLWEPPVSGAELIRDWTGSRSAPASDIWVAGFLMPRELAQQVHSLSLLEYSDLPQEVILAQSIDGSAPPAGPVPDSWRVLRIPGPQTWKEEQDFGAGAAPMDLLREIVACLR